jgi:predicted polyphosphate/ATP-dependent NAD kinase
MGGRVGLKGTDGAETLDEARRRGATPIAPLRARQAVARMAIRQNAIELFTGAGELGEAVARECEHFPKVVTRTCSGQTTAEDTRATAMSMLEAGVDLIVFAGGDGTARDVLDAVGDKAPILGIPTGVKMHSAVFATTPENAGDVARRFLEDQSPSERLRDAEIMDVDERLLLDGRVVTRLYGYGRTPYERLRVQHAKAGIARDDEAALDALCQQIAATLEPGRLYLFGPGTTMQKILRLAGLEGTLLGIDAVRDGELVGVDLAETGILSLIEEGPARIVVSVIGGQGFLFGRGNQQFSAKVLRRVGRENVIVVASREKLLSLDGGCLFIDTDDQSFNASFARYIRVETARDQSVVCKVAS